MVTKNTLKYVHSLARKKYRDREGVFVAEGAKIINDLLPLLTCRTLYATPAYWQSLSEDLRSRVGTYETVDDGTLAQLSALCTPRDALAVFEKRTENLSTDALRQTTHSQLCLALDGVQDPGNVGTILRIADWFGIEHVFASPSTADIYAPKVVQATMGAIGRVSVHYVELTPFLRSLSPETPIAGTFLDGASLYRQTLENKGVIVMGNEGQGISPEVKAVVNRRLYIPPYPQGRATSESLNVAVATAIVCAAYRAANS